MNATTTTGPTWVRPICRPFPGDPEQAALVRDFVARRLRAYGCPDEALHDIVLCADELAANAIRHTMSGWPGGHFFVTVRAANPTVRIEVADAGPVHYPPQADDEHGRGLVVVGALADGSGYEATPFGGLAWFEYTFGEEAMSEDCANNQHTECPACDCYCHSGGRHIG